MKVDDRSFDEPRGRLGQPSLPTPDEDQEASTPPFLRNEASWNVQEIASIWFGESGLCRLQKNDKWLRFWGNEGGGEDADAMAWGIFELMNAAGFSKGCWCRGRWFDKSRNPAGSRRTTGLSMTGRKETKTPGRSRR